MAASKAATEEASANFAAILASIRPKTVAEVSDALRELVAKVRDTGKAGTLSLTIEVKPLDGDPNVLTVNAKAGQKGDVEIPQALTLAIRPYIGGPAYAVTARFRYRIDREQHLRLGYVIERPQVILDAAFEDVLTALRVGRADSTGGEPGAGDDVPAVAAPIYLGRP